MPHPQILFLQSLPQPAQLSPEWHLMRKSRITASSASSLLMKSKLHCGAYVERFNLVDFEYDENQGANAWNSKLDFYRSKTPRGSGFRGSAATMWGQKYEEVAQRLYALKEGTQIYEFGLLPHPVHDFIAASPDGISAEGVCLEFKCPYSRKITGVPSFTYWVQVQFQLQVCSLENADFVELEIKEYLSREEYKLNKQNRDGGLLIQVEQIPDKLKDRTYIYFDQDVDDIDVLREVAKTETLYPHCLVRPVYYVVNVYSKVRIVRDDQWWSQVLPAFQEAAEALLYYQENPDELFVEKCQIDWNAVT